MVYPVMDKLNFFRPILATLFFMACVPLYAAITVDDKDGPITEKEALNKALEEQQKTAESLQKAAQSESIDRLIKSNSLNQNMWDNLAIIDTLYAKGKLYDALRNMQALEEAYHGHQLLADKLEQLTQSLRNLPEHLQKKNLPLPRASFGLLKNALLTGHNEPESISHITMPQLVRQLNYLAEHWEAIVERYGVPTAHRITQGLLFLQEDTKSTATIYSPLLIKQCADTLRIIHNHITHKRHHKADPLVAKLADSGIYPPTLQIYHAYILREEGDFHAGLSKLQKLAERFPAWQEANVQQVYYLTEVNQYDQALEVITEHLSEVERPDILFFHAACLTHKGETAKSLEILKALERSHPRLLKVWLNEPKPIYEQMSENIRQVAVATP